MGIDIGGEADFAEGFGPFPLLEELLGLLHPTLGIAPVVHDPATKRTSKNSAGVQVI
jgi:hypothetical protein